MSANNGGPAFPCGYHPEGNSADQHGLSLLDWFAGQALAGLMASSYPADDSAVKESYQLAAAMLAEKAKREKAQ